MISSANASSFSQIGPRLFRQRQIIDGLKRARQFQLLPAAERELDALLDQLKAANTVAEIEVSR